VPAGLRRPKRVRASLIVDLAGLAASERPSMADELPEDYATTGLYLDLEAARYFGLKPWEWGGVDPGMKLLMTEHYRIRRLEGWNA